MNTLFSFESDAELRSLVANNTRLSVTDAHATEGRLALKVEYLPSKWPNVFFAAKTPWNWRDSGGLAMDITNPGTESIPFFVRIDDDTSADGIVHCRTGKGRIDPGKTETFVISFGIDPMTLGMRGLPPVALGARVLTAGGQGTFDPSHIVAFQIFLERTDVPKTLIVDNIRVVPSVSLDVFGPYSLDKIVDAFGQYAKADWPGKLKNESDFETRRHAEESELATNPTLSERDQFGGWSNGPQLKATGWFRSEKIDGKWWLVTPDGHFFFSMGMDCINLWHKTFITKREAMFAWLPEQKEPLSRHFGTEGQVHSGPVKMGRTYDFMQANLERKYGTDYMAAWFDITLRRLPAWGFNTIGNWSDERLYGNGRVPYVGTVHIGGNHARVSSGSDYWGMMHDPYDPIFVTSVRNSLRKTVERIKDDPWCLGVFVDNELSWGGGGEEGGRYGLAYGVLSQVAEKSAAKRAFLANLKQKYDDISKLNKAWSTDFSNWEAMDAALKRNGEANAEKKADMATFVKEFARQYFGIVRDEVKRVARNHMYLGCRFAWRTPEAVEAAAEICDVVSFNIYAPRVDPKAWAFATGLNKPCIIGEFHFGALDRGMFHTGLVSVSDQKARAAMYQDYLRSVLDHPAFVGCHWFQYVDQPLTGRTLDGENYNIGFVTVTDTPYPEMVEASKAVHDEAYTRRYHASK